MRAICEQFITAQYFAFWQPDAHRIYLVTVYNDLIVKMIAGGIAGTSHIADNLSLAHPCARDDILGKARLMGIGSHITIGVFDYGLFAPSTGPAGFCYHTITCC